MRESMNSDIADLKVFFARIIEDLAREICCLRGELALAEGDRDIYKTENKHLH